MSRSGTTRAPVWRLILNGKAAGNEAVRQAVWRMRERGVALDVRVTWENGDAARFTRLAVEDDVDTVIAGGGDGTLGEVAGTLASLPADAAALPSLGLLPLGTANDFATAAQLPVDPDAALALLRDGRARPIDMLRLRDGERVSWCINLASGGFGTQVTVETDDGLKKLLGGLAYLVTGIAQLGKIDTTTLRVRGPGFAWDGEMIALGVGNGRQAGGGQALCPDALVDDGLLDLTIVPDLSGELAATVGRLITGGREAALERVAERVRLPWVEIAGAAPLALNLDGEPMEATRLRVDCVPARLRMHLPARCPLLATPRHATHARVHIADPH